jgi:ketosteroid isomerase-like protein
MPAPPGYEGAPHAPWEVPRMTEHDAVLAADDARLQALIDADVDALDRLFADELVFVHANGRQDDKAGFLAHTRSGHIHYRSIARGAHTVTVTGSVAILYATVNVEVTMAGEQRSSSVRYMGVWTKRAAGWQMLAIDNVRPS